MIENENVDKKPATIQMFLDKLMIKIAWQYCAVENPEKAFHFAINVLNQYPGLRNDFQSLFELLGFEKEYLTYNQQIIAEVKSYSDSVINSGLLEYQKQLIVDRTQAMNFAFTTLVNYPALAPSLSTAFGVLTDVYDMEAQIIDRHNESLTATTPLNEDFIP